MAAEAESLAGMRRIRVARGSRQRPAFVELADPAILERLRAAIRYSAAPRTTRTASVLSAAPCDETPADAPDQPAVGGKRLALGGVVAPGGRRAVRHR